MFAVPPKTAGKRSDFIYSDAPQTFAKLIEFSACFRVLNTRPIAGLVGFCSTMMHLLDDGSFTTQYSAAFAKVTKLANATPIAMILNIGFSSGLLP
jgi:hypothetical protein